MRYTSVIPYVLPLSFSFYWRHKDKAKHQEVYPIYLTRIGDCFCPRNILQLVLCCVLFSTQCPLSDPFIMTGCLLVFSTNKTRNRKSPLRILHSLSNKYVRKFIFLLLPYKRSRCLGNTVRTNAYLSAPSLILTAVPNKLREDRH